MADNHSPIFEPDEEFSGAISQAAADAPASGERTLGRSERPPGPGLLEAVCWTIGILPLQLMGGIVALCVILVVYLSQSNLAPAELQRLLQDPDQLQQIVNSYPGLNFGITMSVFLVGSLLLILIRLGSQWRRAIPLSFPSPWHVLLTMLWVLPLSIFCGQLAQAADLGWEFLTTQLPELEAVDKLNLMEHLGEIIKGMPDWQVYLFIAVFPAVTEEFIFRILIGRGLVARYGVVAGVALTSLLFASVHLHPVHVVGLIPVAVAIHISYLSARSIWIPMLAHFLNNAFAVTVLLATIRPDTELPPAETWGDDGFLPWWLTLAALLTCLSIGANYWQSRVRIIPHFEEFTPPEPFVSADRDPACPRDVFSWRLPSAGYFAALVLSLLFFGVSLVIHLSNSRV